MTTKAKSGRREMTAGEASRMTQLEFDYASHEISTADRRALEENATVIVNETVALWKRTAEYVFKVAEQLNHDYCQPAAVARRAIRARTGFIWWNIHAQRRFVIRHRYSRRSGTVIIAVPAEKHGNDRCCTRRFHSL